jgi:transcriptional regulator with XRE-family HTH domain
MARTETNEAKRELMSMTVCALTERGWTTAQLAALMFVTPGTVAAWKRGDSMGTNGQRGALAALKTPNEERPRILEIAQRLETEANRSQLQLDADIAEGAHNVAKYRATRIARIRARAEALRKLCG